MRKVTGIQKSHQKSQGGMLHGPSHEQGGIPAIVGGNTPVELEGGEYIVNAQTVDAVGQPFLDKLNSTETEYHTGGYQQGQLPNPSNFDKGGRVKVNKNKLQTGGIPGITGRVANPGPKRRILAHTLREMETPCPTGEIKQPDGSCYKITGEPNTTGGGNRGGGGGGFYREGGMTKPVKKMQVGGRVKSTIKMRKGGVGLNTRRTIVSNGHFHQMQLDVNGNGMTVDGDHVHSVIDNQVGMYCDPDPPYNCHIH